MNTFRNGLVFIALLTLGYPAKAQIRYSDKGDIENTEIVIEKNKKVTFPEIPKTIEKAQITKKTGTTEPQNHSFADPASGVPQYDMKMKLLSIKEDAKSKEYRNFISGGIGNYWTTLLEGNISLKPTQTYHAGIQFKHFAAAFGPIRQEYSGQSKNDIFAYGMFTLKKHELNAHLGTDFHQVRYYGAGNEAHYLARTPTDVLQNYHTLYVKSMLSQKDTSSKIRYSTKAEAYRFSDRFKTNEAEFYLLGKGSYQVNDFSQVLVETNFSQSEKTDSTTQARTLFQFRSQFQYMYNDKLTLRGGVHVAYENDTARNDRDFHLYPVLSATYLATEKWQLEAGLDGGMERNMLRHFTAINPYLGNRNFVLHTNKLWEIFIKSRSPILRYLSYESNLSYIQNRNLPLFVPSFLDSTRFQMLYANGGNLQWINTLQLKISNSLQFYTSVQLHQYYLDTTKAWHKPTFELYLGAQYNLVKKLFINLDISYINGMQAKNFTSKKTYEIPDIINVACKVDYKLRNRFQVFMYFYNMLNQNYQPYVYYPVRGFTVVGGLTYML